MFHIFFAVKVREDMQKKLELKVPRSLVGGFNSLFQLPLQILSDFNSEEKYES